eukprot:2984995-Alexandrium_andersonii.AAC.1
MCIRDSRSPAPACGARLFWQLRDVEVALDVQLTHKYRSMWVSHQWKAWQSLARDVRLPPEHMVRSTDSLRKLQRANSGVDMG